MKSGLLYAALLVVGVAAAAEVAVKMTDPPAMPEADRRAPIALPFSDFPAQASPAPAEVPQRVEAVALSSLQSSDQSSAPPAIFTEPPEAPAPVKPSPFKAIRKNETILERPPAAPEPQREPPQPERARISPVKPFPGAIYVPEPAPVQATLPTWPEPGLSEPVRAESAPPDPVRPEPLRHRVVLEAGMTIPVRVEGPLPGCGFRNETFTASLAVPLIVDRLVIAEIGARATGRCSGTPSQIELVLSRLMTSDGQWVAISTRPWRPRQDGRPGWGAARFEIAASTAIIERLLGR